MKRRRKERNLKGWDENPIYKLEYTQMPKKYSEIFIQRFCGMRLRHLKAYKVREE